MILLKDLIKCLKGRVHIVEIDYDNGIEFYSEWFDDFEDEYYKVSSYHLNKSILNMYVEDNVLYIETEV